MLYEDLFNEYLKSPLKSSYEKQFESDRQAWFCEKSYLEAFFEKQTSLVHAYFMYIFRRKSKET